MSKRKRADEDIGTEGASNGDEEQPGQPPQKIQATIPIPTTIPIPIPIPTITTQQTITIPTTTTTIPIIPSPNVIPPILPTDGEVGLTPDVDTSLTAATLTSIRKQQTQPAREAARAQKKARSQQLRQPLPPEVRQGALLKVFDEKGVTPEEHHLLSILIPLLSDDLIILMMNELFLQVRDAHDMAKQEAYQVVLREWEEGGKNGPRPVPPKLKYRKMRHHMVTSWYTQELRRQYKQIQALTVPDYYYCFARYGHLDELAQFVNLSNQHRIFRESNRPPFLQKIEQFISKFVPLEIQGHIMQHRAQHHQWIRQQAGATTAPLQVYQIHQQVQQAQQQAAIHSAINAEFLSLSQQPNIQQQHQPHMYLPMMVTFDPNASSTYDPQAQAHAMAMAAYHAAVAAAATTATPTTTTIPPISTTIPSTTAPVQTTTTTVTEQAQPQAQAQPVDAHRTPPATPNKSKTTSPNTQAATTTTTTATTTNQPVALHDQDAASLLTTFSVASTTRSASKRTDAVSAAAAAVSVAQAAAQAEAVQAQAQTQAQIQPQAQVDPVTHPDTTTTTTTSAPTMLLPPILPPMNFQDNHVIQPSIPFNQPSHQHPPLPDTQDFSNFVPSQPPNETMFFYQQALPQPQPQPTQNATT